MNKTPSAGDAEKTDGQLVRQLEEARRRIGELESAASESERERQTLQASEERYRAVVENVGIGFTLIGRDHRIILANARQGRMFHKQPAELIGKKCFEEFEKRDAVCPHCPGVQAMATGRPAMVETTGTRDDGSKNFAQIRAFPVLSAEGTPTGFIEIVEDITKRRLAEEAQRKSERQFRLLVEHLTDAFFLYDLDGSILDVNLHACESLGYTREELLDLSIHDVEVESHSGETLDAWARMAPGAPITRETAQRRKDGTTFPVEVRLGVIELGERRLLLALVRDITERKRVEETLARHATRLQTAAEVSHAASSILDPRDLTQQFVELVAERFDLCYAGLFLVDRFGEWTGEADKWVVLRAGTGEVGQRLLEVGHKLTIGERSTVGRCAASQQAHVVLDLNADEVSLEDVLLPETRSQMALPLRVGQRVSGVLDVQSREVAAFSQDDVTVFQTMADQLAVAVENARTVARMNALNEDLQRTLDRQDQLLETIRELSTPVMPLLQGAILLPLVGNIDSGRAQQVMEQLLAAVERHRARMAIVDITGVALVDTAVANSLLQAAAAAKLMGTEVVLVGIRPEVAQTIVGQGVDLSAVITVSDLQSGIEYALRGPASQRRSGGQAGG